MRAVLGTGWIREAWTSHAPRVPAAVGLFTGGNSGSSRSTFHRSINDEASLSWIAATDDKRLVSKSSPQITSKTVTSSEAKRRVKRDVFQRAFGGVSSTQRDGPPHQLSGGDGTHV